ncbi:polysaccharide deacetylase family protein [Clostridium sp. HCS.1]|uniref:polysaccharide deacetylase family protein n=1 Tax=Clostridium sp. HCS.1 TaxID=3238594 RepID=UPI003A0FEFE8
MIWIDIKKDEFIIEKKYTFDLIFSTLGLSYDFYKNDNLVMEDDILICYSPILEKKMHNKFIWIKESNNLFSKDYLKCPPKYNVKLFNLDYKIKSISDIISIFSNEDKLFDKKDNGFYVYADIISDIFFMVSRYEEIIVQQKDNHERFLLESSIAYKFKFLNRPIVNEQMEFVMSLIKKLDEKMEKENKLGNKDFVFFLSHDIDSILKYRDKFVRTIGNKILREKNIKASFETLSNYFKSLRSIEKDPFWKFDYLASIEEKYGISASYYFMSGGVTGKDNYYNIDNKLLREVFNRINKNCSEIGIHGSYNSYNDFNLLNSEKIRLSKYADVVGIRQHYLRFEVPNTWNVQEKCNLKYDTTLGYAKFAGFRAGICTPYKPFNVLNKTVINIWEIPLIVMDGTLSEAQYMGLSPEGAIEYVRELIKKIIDVNGVFSFLWHNSSLDETSIWKEWKDVYEEIISYCISNNALAISGEKIVKIYE